MEKKSKAKTIITYVLLIIGLFFILSPLYLTLVNSFKTTKNITSDFYGMPDPFTTDNYKRLVEDGVGVHFMNSLIITVVSVGLIILVVPMAAYAIARSMKRKRSYRALYILLILGLFIPFQVVMIPTTKNMGDMGLMNIPGLIILYLTFGIPQALFQYTGYITTSVPEALDEAASIDGGNPFQIYWKIIFPVCKPMHATVGIMNALWVWNDFTLPLLILNRNKETWTLPLFQNNYQGQYFNDFGPSFASYVVGIATILIVYLIFQRQIMDGMTSGAVK